MKHTTTIRRTGVAAAALALSFGLAACGSDDDSSADANNDTTTSQSPAGDSGDTGDMATNAGAETFGPGCSAIPKAGAGPFNVMATAPGATPARANPLLEPRTAAAGPPALSATLKRHQPLPQL